MANFIKPYNNDPFVGHLATPITSSAPTREILKNLPIYRFALDPILRGLEVGVAHGYFLIGPFTKLGPLRNSEISLIAGFLSTIGLIVILAFGLGLYGEATYSSLEVPLLVVDSVERPGFQTKQSWQDFQSGFLLGGFGSATFAFICLSSVPIRFLS